MTDEALPILQRVVALVDGSMYTHSVCDHASWVASRAHAAVTIAHVLSQRDGDGEPANLSGSIGFNASATLMEELVDLDQRKARLEMARGRALLADASSRVSDAGVTTVDTRLRHGEFVDTVGELSADADLVVIGKRGENADFNSMHLGSYLERIVRSSDKPTLVASRAFRPIKRCLIAFDGGASATRAVAHIANQPMFSETACHLLTVGTPSESLRHALEGAGAQLREAGYEVTTEVAAGQPETMLAERADAEDLLVMGAYGHSRIRNLIIGSTTTEMIRSCLVPVLLFR